MPCLPWHPTLELKGQLPLDCHFVKRMGPQGVAEGYWPYAPSPLRCPVSQSQYPSSSDSTKVTAFPWVAAFAQITWFSSFTHWVIVCTLSLDACVQGRQNLLQSWVRLRHVKWGFCCCCCCCCFLPCWEACGICGFLLTRRGIELWPPAMEVSS